MSFIDGPPRINWRNRSHSSRGGGCSKFLFLVMLVVVAGGILILLSQR
jgi:hypothetical protein